MKSEKLNPYIIAYDITSDKTRRYIVKALQEAGLYRIQKSVFLGATTQTQINELEALFEFFIAQDQSPSDNYIIIPVNKETLSKMKFITEQEIDLDFYTGKKIVIFI